MTVLREFRARNEHEVDIISGVLHDAYFWPDLIEFDTQTKRLMIPAAQESGEWLEASLPRDCGPKLVKSGLASTEYLIPLLSTTVTIDDVADWNSATEGWDEPGMISEVVFDSSSRMVAIQTATGPEVLASVVGIQITVAVSDHVVGHLRRREGLASSVDTPEWQSREPAA